MPENKNYLFDWPSIIREVLARAEAQTKWWAPENWMLAELYNKFSKEFETSTEPIWYPFYRDCPYKTAHPVRKPRNDNWKKEGATKYVDLCLLSKKTDPWRWLWLELKMRNSRGEVKSQSAKGWLPVYVKDIVALLGMSIEQTAFEWEKATGLSKELYADKAEELRRGYHRGVALFIQIGGDLEKDIWNESEIRNRIERYIKERKKDTEILARERDFHIRVYEKPVKEKPEGNKEKLKYWSIETGIEIK